MEVFRSPTPERLKHHPFSDKVFTCARAEAQAPYEQFEQLVCNQQFQETACQEERHQIFLFQAVLSALVDLSLDEQRIRILPPTYNYPYNLQGQIGKAQRVDVDVMRKAGIPVRGRARSAGLFSGGKVNVTLSVPDRLRTEAMSIISQHFGNH